MAGQRSIFCRSNRRKGMRTHLLRIFWGESTISNLIRGLATIQKRINFAFIKWTRINSIFSIYRTDPKIAHNMWNKREYVFVLMWWCVLFSLESSDHLFLYTISSTLWFSAFFLDLFIYKGIYYDESLKISVLIKYYLFMNYLTRN